MRLIALLLPLTERFGSLATLPAAAMPSAATWCPCLCIKASASACTRAGRGTSRLLNDLDPPLDVSVGDLPGAARRKETHVGIGIARHWGIFGASQLPGNINGGPNFLVADVESTLSTVW